MSYYLDPHLQRVIDSAQDRPELVFNFPAIDPRNAERSFRPAGRPPLQEDMLLHNFSQYLLCLCPLFGGTSDPSPQHQAAISKRTSLLPSCWQHQAQIPIGSLSYLGASITSKNDNQEPSPMQIITLDSPRTCVKDCQSIE